MNRLLSAITRKHRAALMGVTVGFCAVVGSVVALAFAENDSLPGAPEHTLLPGEPSSPSSPPGSSKIEHVAPGGEVRIGRFRLLAAGSVPESRWAVIPSQPAAERGVNLLDSNMVNAARAQGLKVALLDSPAPFKETLAEASWFATDTNAPPWLWREFFRLEADGYFPIDVSVRLARPGSFVDLIDYDPSSGQVWAVEDVAGVTVLFAHGTSDIKVQPIIQAFFFLGDYLISIDAPALPPEQSDSVARSLINGLAKSLEEATEDARKGAQ